MSTPFAGSTLDFAHPFSDALVARWIFNNGFGATQSKDLVSHQNPAVIENGAVIGVKSGTGLCISFTPSALYDRARVGNYPAIDTLALNPFSVSILFFMRVPIPGTFSLVSKMDAVTGKRGWFVDVGNTGQIIFDGGLTSTNMQLATGYSGFDIVQQGFLYHVLCVWNSQSAAGNAIYLQGVPPPTYAVFGSPVSGIGSILSDAATDLAIGSGYGGTNGNFQDDPHAAADIIDVNIWNKEIDATLAAQIAADPFANIFRNFGFSYSF